VPGTMNKNEMFTHTLTPFSRQWELYNRGL